MPTTPISQDESLLYLYKDGTKTQLDVLQEAIFSNDELTDSFFEMLDTKRQLDKVEFSPSARAINNILEYAREANFETV